MPRDFYPFVEEGTERDDAPVPDGVCQVTHPARIAVYDDAAAAPRVVVVEPGDVRSYLEEITQTVTRLSHEQGGAIPFMVIREIVENFIHAYFQAPTITILDAGNTIRFSDQGPGIREKGRALEYGTSSATEEMKRYIRGVGSGLPYVQQYMEDKGGSLEIEDNISGGTVVTISTHPSQEAREQANAREEEPPTAVPGPSSAGAPSWPQQAPQGWPQAAGPWGWPQQVAPWPQQQAFPQQQAWQQPYQQTPAPWPQQAPQAPWQQAAPAGAPAMAGAGPAAQVHVDERGRQALALLAERGSAGPTDLVQAYGSSSATWSRALSALAAQGAVLKGGQKYQLTEFGRALAATL